MDECAKVKGKLIELEQSGKTQSSYQLKGGRKLYSFEKYSRSHKSHFGLRTEFCILYDGRPVLPVDHVAFVEEVRNVATECLPLISNKGQLLPAIKAKIDVDAVKLQETFPLDEFFREAQGMENGTDTELRSAVRGNTEGISGLISVARSNRGDINAYREDIRCLTVAVRGVNDTVETMLATQRGMLRAQQEHGSTLREHGSTLREQISEVRSDVQVLTGSHHKLSTEVQNIKEHLSLSARKSSHGALSPFMGLARFGLEVADRNPTSQIN